MSGKAKKIALWVCLAFAAYAIVTQPEVAAAAVLGTVHIVWMALTSIGVFFHSLLK